MAKSLHTTSEKINYCDRSQTIIPNHTKKERKYTSHKQEMSTTLHMVQQLNLNSSDPKTKK